MNKVYLHALPVRIWHWNNAFCFLVLIVTGAQIRYRDVLDLMSFKSAVDIHNFFGFLLLANFLLWVVYYMLSQKLKIYIPDPNDETNLRVWENIAC